MVFFTCNHCGESLKKPSVEKHYQFKSCRGAIPYLTCVDCLKDYSGDEYKAHTKCVTEEERYAEKGFVAKPTKNKGAEKQESWTETLQNLINKPGLDPQVKHSIERIVSQTNVPRKKPKFINFIKNSLRISADNAQKIWNIVEEALEEFKKITEAKNIQKRELEKKTKKNDDETSLKQTENQSISVEGSKKKKKKKNSIANGAQTVDVSNENDNKKKQKKKRTLESVNDENSTEEPPTKMKKKNKIKKKDEMATSDESVATNGNSHSVPDDERYHNANVNNDEPEYNWQTEIVKILSKKNSPMPVDKLKAKIVKKYLAQTGKEVSRGVEKKFLKKLKTISNVAIEGECVKLVG